MKTSRFPFVVSAILIALIAFPAWGQNLPHPYDNPAINFQGRIEAGDLGFSGASWFHFTIGNYDMSSTYWTSFAETTCVEGIYNVILGRDTDALPATIFTGYDSYYLQVAFSTDGSYFETLAPVQEILTVPFAVNADLLDGLESPESAFVGVTDVQTVTNKTLTDPTLTRPVIDSSYFFVTPGALPADAAAGYFAYDTADNSFKYFDGSDWVSWGEGSVTSPWIRQGTTIIPRNEGDFVQLTGASRLLFSRSVYGSAGSPLISFNPEDGGTGIFKDGPDQIDFSTQSSRRFTVRSTGAIRFIPIPQPATGLDGDFYYDTDLDSLMYYKGATWHPVASGTGSIMDPLGPDSTLRGSDGTTWVATTGFLISATGSATVHEDMEIKQKLHFWDDTNTYIHGPRQNNLEFYTDGARALTIDGTQRFNLRASGSAPLPVFSIGSDIDTGIYTTGNDILAFATGGIHRFSIRSGGEVNFEPLAASPAGHQGDLYYDSAESSFMYYDGGWHPIASGSGSIMSPLGADSTLRGSDGTTWVATTGFLISADGTATVQKDIRIRQKMFFYGDTNTYIQGPSDDVLDIYTGNARALTIDDTQRFNLQASGTALLPAFTIGSDVDTGIYHISANNLGVATAGTRRFAVRSQGHTVFEPLGAEPAGSLEGGLYFNSQSDTFMYCKSNGGAWYPIASGEGSIPSPNAEFDTLYASDADTWTPNDEFNIRPGERVVAKNELQVGSSAYGKKLYFYSNSSTYITVPRQGFITLNTDNTARWSIDSNGDMVFNDGSGQADARFEGDDDANLLFLDGGVNGIGMGLGQGSVGSYKLNIQQTQNKGSIFIDQDGNGDAINIDNDAGASSNSIDIAHGASTGEEAIQVANAAADQALIINQAGDIANATVDADDGGAIHVYNSTSTGSAI
ncbi:MAG: hypothetical protein P9M08_11035, partial [Candidatus Erginobacter occultus]|nr:hypothetical protein [Candidatus Erginobacter occultus]